MTRHTVLLIAGMRDNRCRERIAAILSGLAGVKETFVNLHRASATVAHDPACDPMTLARAVAVAGYRATPAQPTPRHG
jgi:copper chaperone CopZ